MVETTETFADLFFGQMNLAQWKFQLFLITIGIFLRIFRRISKREDKEKPFSIKFWFSDFRNLAKLMYSFILMYILVRFYSEYKESLDAVIPNNINASIYLVMVGIGFFLHKISDWLDIKISK